MEEAELFDKQENDVQAKQRVQDVLLSQTQLSKIIAEVGGYLSVI